ncbi:MAG: VWA domain-containing protein [Deltaproteobacteria bacterium]|nr:VWA domain-containing protein [Deltaproteobacteria bacterium]
MKPLASLGLLFLGACTSALTNGGAGDFGATPGGIKDLRLARELIAKGLIPPADALLVEAMFVEHDLPVDGPPCASTLCLRAAAGFAPEVDGTPRGWAQIGLSSSIDPDAFVRPSTTFVFTVDVSGSMGWGFGDDEHPTPGRLAKQLMHALADELRPDDRVAIVTYGTGVATALSLRSGSRAQDVHAAVDALREDGSTNMEAGLRRAIAVAEQAPSLGATRQTRIVLFTDTQPNVGATTGSEFEEIVSGAAAKGIHTTVLALGLGIGPEVMRGMAAVRGANAYSLTRAAEVEQFMAEDYPWFTTPIAFGLRVNFTAGDWSIQRGLGFPAASDAAQVGLKAETVFLSRHRGALLAAFASPGGDPATTPAGLAGTVSLAYTEPAGNPVAVAVPFGHDGGAVDARGHWFAQHGAARTTALALFTEAMHAAAAAYATHPDDAEAIMGAAQARFAADAEALADADLPVEVELGAALLKLIVDRAEQGTLYGDYR